MHLTLKQCHSAKSPCQVICATRKTEKEQIRLENNTVMFQGGQEPVPNGFYTKVSACEQGDLEGAWDNHGCAGCFEDKVQETHEPGAQASFKW